MWAGQPCLSAGRERPGELLAKRLPRPVEPLDFQPPKDWTPGHAPVVAPPARFAYVTPAWTQLKK